jgi:hypothetical protein
MRVRRLVADFGLFSSKGTAVADLLWLLVIGFVFAIVTGIVG